MPYTDQLSALVVHYLENEGIEVSDYRNFSVANNQEVGRIPGERLIAALDDLKTREADAVVLSACVQMPSLAVLEQARRKTGRPVTSTAECTAKTMIRALGISIGQELSAVA